MINQVRKGKNIRTIFSFSNSINYFKLFNLPYHFNEQQLKTSYLELVKKYHPDLSTQPNAVEMFRQIQQGYEILSSPQSRSKHQLEQSAPGDTQQKDIYDQMVEKYYKTYQRKDPVNDEFNFSYKLFKQHYEKVEAPKADFQRYEGQGGNQYFAHKQEKGEQLWKPLVGGAAAVSALALAYFYTHS